jgi:hypothetical protein
MGLARYSEQEMTSKLAAAGFAAARAPSKNLSVGASIRAVR